MTSPSRVVILASYASTSTLETDILSSLSATWMYWHGTPKALLPISTKSSLSWTMDHIKHLNLQTTVIANAYNYKQYERWSTEYGFPAEKLLNCGFSAGALEDLGFMQRVRPSADGDVLVLLADTILGKEDVAQLTNERGPCVYRADGQPIAFVLTQSILQQLGQATYDMCVDRDNIHSFTAMQQELLAYLRQHTAPFVELSQPSELYRFADPQVSLHDYETHWRPLTIAAKDESRAHRQPIQIKSHARVGLMGNPSDGFYGCTMSLLIANFWAQVTLIPNADVHDGTIELLTHRGADNKWFVNVESLALCCEQDGYDHGERLLLACIKVFLRHCQQQSIAHVNDNKQGFRVGFLTNIPRQVGLAGSSAIVSACWRALMQHYHVTNNDIPLEHQASLVLQVEVDELGIAAGLQDRVIQIYGGLVFMDFNKDHMLKHGHGVYESLPLSITPPLWLAYVAHPEDSGKVHSTVKQRFLQGDPQVVDAMKTFASLATQARDALKNGDHSRFGHLMTANFETRRQTYGDAVVGEANLHMVQIVRQHGGHAKFCGSGGAIVISMHDRPMTSVQALKHALEKEGYVFVKLIPQSPIAQ